jgi:hypothetical protein
MAVYNTCKAAPQKIIYELIFLPRTQVRSIAIDMRNMLSLLHNSIVVQQAAPRCLGGHWKQAPVTLEDALGFMIPIPLELVNSWDVCVSIGIKNILISA